MTARPGIQTIGSVLLAAAMLALTIFCQRFWQQSIEDRKQESLKSRLETMIFDAADFQKITLDVNGRTVRPSRSSLMTSSYRATDSRGQTLGFIILFAGRGFQSDIEGLVALNASGDKVLRLIITESQESPHKQLFEEYPQFIKQFQGVDCTSPMRLMHPQDRGLHAISGASISSQIVVRFLNECIAALQRHLQTAGGREKALNE